MEHDDGFSFGIGAFETMLVHDGRVVLADPHVGRLNRALEELGIPKRFDTDVINDHVSDGRLDGRVLKLEVSERNTIFSDRPVQYTEDDYVRGFDLTVSEVRRNETSAFTYIKSLQYGENIMEKRRAKAKGFDEPIFLNSRGEVCEGATSNIFFTRDGCIVTPDIGCGLLPGTVREYVIDSHEVEVRRILPDELDGFDGCFLTNAVMGIMPVRSFDGIVFGENGIAWEVRRRYLSDIEKGL